MARGSGQQPKKREQSGNLTKMRHLMQFRVEEFGLERSEALNRIKTRNVTKASEGTAEIYILVVFSSL